jgi:hypothetical protein
MDKTRIVQVSDRRLTWPDGRLHDDTANKAVCIGMSHIHFCAGYTGLAYIGQVRNEDRTDYWLLEHLGSITREGQPGVEDVCNSLGERATTALAGLRVKQGLKVVLAGYEGNNRSFRATVSNMRVGSDGSPEVRDRFVSEVRRFYPWDPKPNIDAAGATAVFDAPDRHAKALRRIRDKVAKHIKKHGERVGDDQVARLLVAVVNSAHTHPKYGRLIGRDCVSVGVFRQRPGMTGLLSASVLRVPGSSRDAPFVAHYHPALASTVHHQPHLADPYMDYMNLEADENPQVPGEPPAEHEPGTALSSRVRIKVHRLPDGPG